MRSTFRRSSATSTARSSTRRAPASACSRSAPICAGARVFHWDVGDGHFVPPITMGPVVLASISELVHSMGGVVDVHLMTEEPAKHFGAFAEAGANSVTFHYEAVDDVDAVVRAAREHDLEVGLAIKPGTEV